MAITCSVTIVTNRELDFRCHKKCKENKVDAKPSLLCSSPSPLPKKYLCFSSALETSSILSVPAPRYFNSFYKHLAEGWEKQRKNCNIIRIAWQWKVAWGPMFPFWKRRGLYICIAGISLILKALQKWSISHIFTYARAQLWMKKVSLKKENRWRIFSPSLKGHCLWHAWNTKISTRAASCSLPPVPSRY